MSFVGLLRCVLSLIYREKRESSEGVYCVENPSCAVWNSGTFRERGQYHLAMQDDGNLVIYLGRPPDDASKAIWNTSTFRTKSNYFLSLQDDGSIVICLGTGPSDNKGVIWSSK